MFIFTNSTNDKRLSLSLMISLFCQELTDDTTLEEAKAMDEQFNWNAITATTIAEDEEFKKSLMITLGVTKWTSAYAWIRMLTVKFEEWWHLKKVSKMSSEGRITGDKVRALSSNSLDSPLTQPCPCR